MIGGGTVVSLIILLVAAQQPSGDEILQRVDRMLGADSKIIVSRMVIHGRRDTRTVEAKTWQRGARDSFTEYLAPPREKGTKMLKLGDQLWMYSPSTDRTIMISGHMLRQSVMGSDLSYEDMLEDPHLPNLYNARVVGEEDVNGARCWVLELIAKTETVAYYRRMIWVDKNRYVILRAHLFARSGKLLKTLEVREVRRVENRWVPVSILYKDALKEGGGTEFFIDSILFNAYIPEHLFTKAALRK